MKTQDTWQTAHEAILSGDWATARKALDDLGQHGQEDGRHDTMTNLDECNTGKELMKTDPDLALVIQDRIDLHNAKVENWMLS